MEFISNAVSRIYRNYSAFKYYGFIIVILYFAARYFPPNSNLSFFQAAKMCTSVKLNTGASLPIMGLGTWKSKPGEVAAAVKHALKSGYRHIDCAFVYGNENEVGEGLKFGMQDLKVQKNLEIHNVL